MILDSAGNAIASFTDEMTARATIHAIIRIEPESADELVLLAYDDDGMPVGQAQTFFDVPPAVTIDDPPPVVQSLGNARSFTRASSSKRTLNLVRMQVWGTTVVDTQPAGRG
jgi:hypothetical protein